MNTLTNQSRINWIRLCRNHHRKIVKNKSTTARQIRRELRKSVANMVCRLRKGV